jgi:predicted aspartyl protease
MHTFKLLGILALGAGAIATANAEEICPPAQRIASVDMQIGNDGRIYVPVRLNQSPKSMMVDTGGFFSVINSDIARELHLPQRHTKFELVGVAGDTTNIATRATFDLGTLHADPADFMVAPDAGGFADDVPGVAGILAPNLLHKFDVDIDFANMKFSLYSQDHCYGKAVPWPANTVSAVPMSLDENDHIAIPVVLDEKKMTAILDTGAIHTVLNLEIAQRDFGLKPGDADTPEVGRLLRSPESKTYFHRFNLLSMQGIAISNPTVRVIPDLMRTKMGDPGDSLNGGTRIPKTSAKPGFGDLILGMNILRQWHIYIAYNEEMVYLAPSPVTLSMEPTKADDQPAAVKGQIRRERPNPLTLQGR